MYSRTPPSEARPGATTPIPMSSRRPAPQPNADAFRLQRELESLKQQTVAVEAAATAAESSDLVHTVAGDGTSPHHLEKLSGTEQAAGSLGVHPAAWKPIRFMNNKHFEALVKANALDDNLARRIEAFRAVAAA